MGDCNKRDCSGWNEKYDHNCWHMDLSTYDHCFEPLIEKTASGSKVPCSDRVMPCGLSEKDTIEDALKRADSLAGADWHSGSLCDRKDLRRIVLLAHEYRKLQKA